ncbi:hypothetical protein [Rhodovulum euryhalinum]|uniref:Putative phage baseplate assembly protein n=1 Tax=Rhodovulum euryhalinum TaxID=35805 RepID=A0A4R2KD98_9RHOB|nr:hypothetical protein [Rhodovulum euryhalinum]TCO70107.1 putative phage baseplate assembly protein [Rhodovulum euryhalinum]
MSCNHDCARPPRFPATVANRPGLSRFAYRIGDYGSMRGHILDRLVKEPALSGWTHLKSDEPGIALLEGAAILGDILTFYQELYANETRLGTAAWQESIFDLVQLTGYRPAPGLGGTARFALDLRGADPVIVPRGFGFQAKLEGADKPAVFESTAAITAWPGLGSFHLYRRRQDAQAIAPGTTALDIIRLGTATDLATRAGHGIAAGDRILILSGPFDPYEILVVRETEEHLDRVTLHLEGAVRESHPAEVTAYRLGRTFRHYGADAPRQFFTFREDPPKTFSHDTTYFRATGSNHAGNTYHSALKAREIPLDSEVDDLATGSTIVCTGRTVLPTARDFAFVRRVERVTPRDILWANATAPVSLIELSAALRTDTLAAISASEIGAFGAKATPGLQVIDAEMFELAISKGGAIAKGKTGAMSKIGSLPDIVAEIQTQSDTGPGAMQVMVQGMIQQVQAQVVAIAETHDIRRLRLHETTGARMILRAPPRQKSSVADGKVNFFGTREEAEALAGRTILLAGLTETPEEITVAEKQPELDATPKGPQGDRRIWPIALGAVPKSGAAGFSETDPVVTAHGNIVTATQGESQAEAVIGSGDARLAFQTFAIPKSPLTFLPDSARTPPYAPELEVRVDGRLWTRVATFFGQAADAEVYVVRSDGEGGHVVQFGDGLSGARLTSGRNNVTAAWRVGAGAAGDLADGEEPKAKDRLKPLSGVLMPGPVTGGAAAEGPETARAAAPGRMQSLGRLVGLADYEAEALMVPGVIKAGAVFAAEAERPSISLTVLTEDESPESVAAAAAALRHADRCRGPARHPLQVVPGRRRWVHLSLLLGYDPTYRSADLDAAVRTALGTDPSDGTGAPGTGLFALPLRRFGQDVHISQAVGAAQAVPGIVWVRPVAFGKLPATSDDPEDLSVPPKAALLPRLQAAPAEVLVLSALHLTLSASTVTSDAECPE